MTLTLPQTFITRLKQQQCWNALPKETKMAQIRELSQKALEGILKAIDDANLSTLIQNVNEKNVRGVESIIQYATSKKWGTLLKISAVVFMLLMITCSSLAAFELYPKLFLSLSLTLIVINTVITIACFHSFESYALVENILPWVRDNIYQGEISWDKSAVEEKVRGIAGSAAMDFYFIVFGDIFKGRSPFPKMNVLNTPPKWQMIFFASIALLLISLGLASQLSHRTIAWSLSPIAPLYALPHFFMLQLLPHMVNQFDETGEAIKAPLKEVFKARCTTAGIAQLIQGKSSQ